LFVTVMPIQFIMTESRWPYLLQLSTDAEAALVAGARDTGPVCGLTHGFYKYPARFSPAFVRAAIETFTRPGELVLDNHVGGGSTLVEALAMGRDAIGVDISPLAEFVARVKTTVFSEAELDSLEAWGKRVSSALSISSSGCRWRVELAADPWIRRRRCGCSHVCTLSIDDERIMEVAKASGADVPVCLARRARIMHGIGDELGPLLALPPIVALLVNPGVPVATKSVFARMNIGPGTAARPLPGHQVAPRVGAWIETSYGDSGIRILLSPLA
jgi:DNA methylase